MVQKEMVVPRGSMGRRQIFPGVWLPHCRAWWGANEAHSAAPWMPSLAADADIPLSCTHLSPCSATMLDYDAVATWIKDGTQSFAPIQLKEVPPAALNPRASVQEVIDGLGKYPGSEDVTVVVHLNQRTRFLPSELTIPPLRLAALWVFAGITPDQSRWAMWGNLLEPVESWQAGTFDYPEPA